MGYLGETTLTQVFTRGDGTGVSLRDVTRGQMGNGHRECRWRHAPEASVEDLGDFRKVSNWEVDSEREWSTLYISLPFVETFNSKVIKGFLPELSSRYVCFVFRDSYVLCIYVRNIRCTFRISVSGYGTMLAKIFERKGKSNWKV